MVMRWEWVVMHFHRRVILKRISPFVFGPRQVFLEIHAYEGKQATQKVLCERLARVVIIGGEGRPIADVVIVYVR